MMKCDDGLEKRPMVRAPALRGVAGGPKSQSWRHARRRREGEMRSILCMAGLIVSCQMALALEAPELRIEPAADDRILLTWPASPAPWTLEKASSLEPGTAWSVVPRQPVRDGGRDSVVLEPAGPVAFYRLRLPERVTMPIHIQFPAASIRNGPRGASVSVDGFHPAGLQGDPRLPARSYSIVLPPNADTKSVRVEIVGDDSIVLPVGRLEPMGGWFEFREEDGTTGIAREDGVQLQNELNPAVYGVDGLFPPERIGPPRVDSFRGWKILGVPVFPVQYNDGGRALRVARSLDLEVTYVETASVPALDPRLLSTGVESVREIVAESGLQLEIDVLESYDVSPDDPEPSGDYDYVIVVAGPIYDEREDNGLQAFIEHKELLGHRVKVGVARVIYADYPDADSQLAIKKYLKDCYETWGIKYALLVGNPDTRAKGEDVPIQDEAIVPMRECLPNDQSSMTDMYYTDFDADWDDESGGDGDGKYAENWDETGYPDIYVGRVAPVGGYIDDVYSNDGSAFYEITRKEKLRTVFRKMILYDREIDKTWRYQMLAMGSYMYGKNGGTTATTLTKTISYIHDDNSNFEAYTVYQDGTQFGLTDEWFDGHSNPEASAALVGSATLGDTSTAFYAWSQQSFGMVFWRGHGSYRSVSVGDDVSGSSNDTNDGSLIHRGWVLIPGSYSGYGLANDYPSVVFSASCNNLSTGYSSYGSWNQVAKWASLAQTLQYMGAICVVGASNTTASENPCPEDPSFGQSAWYQRDFLRKIAQGWRFGKAYMHGKREVQSAYSSNHKTELRDWLRINFLGDPAQELLQDLDVFPDDDFDEGDGNDELGDATVIHSGRYVPKPFETDLTVQVTGAVSKDRDWYLLEELGTQSKSVTVTVARDESMGDVEIAVLNSNETAVPGTDDSDDSQRTLSCNTNSSLVYVGIKKGRYVLDYDLKVEVDDN